MKTNMVFVFFFFNSLFYTLVPDKKSDTSWLLSIHEQQQQNAVKASNNLWETCQIPISVQKYMK